MATAIAEAVRVVVTRKTDDGVRMGEEIESVRRESGFTQQEVADRLGMSLQGYLGYRKGYSKVNQRNLKQWAKALDMAPDKLAERLGIDIVMSPRAGDLRQALTGALGPDKAEILEDVVDEIKEWPESEQDFVIDLFKSQVLNWPRRPPRD